MYAKSAILIGFFAALAGCGGGGGSSTTAPNDPAPTQSEFRSFSDVGAGFDPDVNHRIMSLSRNGGAGFQIALGKATTETFDGYAANVGINTDFTSNAPTVGSVTYSAQYIVYEMTDMTERPSDFTGSDSPFETRGYIAITANFDDAGVTGTSDLLSVDATLDANAEFTGTATWRGVEAELAGGVGVTDEGRNLLVGGFHGSNTETVFAGGLFGREPIP